MDTQLIRFCLQQLAAGNLQPDQEEALLQYLEKASDAELAAIYPAAEWGHVTPVAVTAAEKEQMFRRITGETLTPLQALPRKRHWLKVAAVAAVVIPAVLLLGAYFRLQPAKPATMKWITLSTANGEKKLIALPDSTRIYMNGATKMMIPENFTGDKREVRLCEGEVYLEVGRDARRPFTITAGEVKVAVLGTSFNLRNYPDEPSADVHVSTGKVAVTAAGHHHTRLLTAGEHTRYEKTTGLLEKDNNSRGVAGWLKQEFYFDEVPLKTVLAELQHCYGLRFHTDQQQLLERPVRATFHQQHPDEIIRILSIMGRFTYHKKDSVIHIYSPEKKDQPKLK